jgi:ABC-type protease/lipase transport system fused ATPase/permease subunit
MRIKQVSFLAPLLPLFVVIVLALFGFFFHFWVYLLIVIACPAVAGVIWFTYRDTERKVSKAKKEIEKVKK